MSTGQIESNPLRRHYRPTCLCKCCNFSISEQKIIKLCIIYETHISISMENENKGRNISTVIFSV